MFKIIPILALQDNYIWSICNSDFQEVIIVDPGDDKPVLDFLYQNNLKLTAILITHHHMDHTAGLSGILSTWDAPVYGSSISKIKYITNKLHDGDLITFFNNNISFKVLEIPGHTLDHIAYYGEELLFSGDTLFTGGCGRIFEGTAWQMFASLGKLKTLPGETKLYCGHEYTLSNLYFAKKIEPNNILLQQRFLEVEKCINNKLPTVPATLSIEVGTNPFLRTKEKEVILSVQQYYEAKYITKMDISEYNLFAVLRGWKG